MGASKKVVSDCPIDAALSVINGRWKGTILWRLADGPMRTAELRRSIESDYEASEADWQRSNRPGARLNRRPIAWRRCS